MAGEGPPLLSVTSQGSAPPSLRDPRRREVTAGSASIWRGPRVLAVEAKVRASGDCWGGWREPNKGEWTVSETLHQFPRNKLQRALPLQVKYCAFGQ